MTSVSYIPVNSRPEHWSDEFLGIPFAECDCVALCGRVAAYLGVRVRLPGARPAPASPFSYSQAIQSALDEYLEPITWAPIEGDIALMRLRARLCHVGIYCEPGGVESILHTDQAHGSSVRVPITRLRYWQITVEGYYRWRR